MVISVRNTLLRTIVLLFGICPLWAVAGDQELELVSESEPESELGGEPQHYGPIIATDTLAGIAIELKGDGPWHYQRWMYALYRKNSQAFFGSNMNNIKLGILLMVPTEAELERVDLAEAFRAVKVQLYVLKQERREKRESDEALLLRARMQRLFVSNEMMQQQSGELFDRISSLEQQVGSVVDRVLESEELRRPGAVQVAVRETTVDSYQTKFDMKIISSPDEEIESQNSTTWWFILLSVTLVYGAGFFWRRRVEAAL